VRLLALVQARSQAVNIRDAILAYSSKAAVRPCPKGVGAYKSGRTDISERLAAKRGTYNVRVFGSFARGEAGPHSDLDLLISVGPKTTPWFPGGLVADSEKLLGRRVDVVTDALSPLIRDRVLSEAVSLSRMTALIWRIFWSVSGAADLRKLRIYNHSAARVANTFDGDRATRT